MKKVDQLNNKSRFLSLRVKKQKSLTASRGDLKSGLEKRESAYKKGKRSNFSPNRPYWLLLARFFKKIADQDFPS